jgi:hypothetical protein
VLLARKRFGGADSKQPGDPDHARTDVRLQPAHCGFAGSASLRHRVSLTRDDRAKIHRRSVVRFGEQAVVRQLEAEYRKALARPLQDAPR